MGRHKIDQLNPKHPLHGSSMLTDPLETHTFEIDPRDDYRCAKCHRPRALHKGPPDPYIAK